MSDHVAGYRNTSSKKSLKTILWAYIHYYEGEGMYRKGEGGLE